MNLQWKKERMKLWYTKPAAEWVEALPMGNGHMGAMAFGGESGQYILTENTCWSGSKQESCLKEGAGESMRKVRRLLMQRRYEEAEELLWNCVGKKGNYGTQVPMGKAKAEVLDKAVKQTRSLNLLTGVCTDELFLSDGRTVTRTTFLSNPDKVMAAAGSVDVPVWQIPASRRFSS